MLTRILVALFLLDLIVHMLLAIIVDTMVQIRIGQVRIHILLRHVRIVLQRIRSRPAAGRRRRLITANTNAALQSLHIRRFHRSQIVQQLRIVGERVHRIVEMIAIGQRLRIRMVLHVGDDRLQVAHTPSIVQHDEHDDADQDQNHNDTPSHAGRAGRLLIVGVNALRQARWGEAVFAVEAVPTDAAAFRMAQELQRWARTGVHAVFAVVTLRADYR